LVWDPIQIHHLGRRPLQSQPYLGERTNNTKASVAWVVIKPNHADSMRKDSASLEQTVDTVMTLQQVPTTVVLEVGTKVALAATSEEGLGQIHHSEVRDGRPV
jgi:hypothetical protein